MKSSKHGEDFFSWTQEQAALLRAMPETVDLLDIDCLADEIEGMGQAEVHRIGSLLLRVLSGLVKITFVPGRAPDRQIYHEILSAQGDAALTMSTGLHQHLDLPKIWQVARNMTTRSLQRSGMAVPALPEVCPLSLDQLLDPQFSPDDAAKKISAAIERNI